MEIIIKRDAEEVAAEAYEIIAAELARRPAGAIGLATGRSPSGLYRLLRESRIDFSQVRFFNVDEFAGIGAEHPASFARYLHEVLLGRINARPERIRLMRGDAPDVAVECDAYEEAIHTAGGIDVQILGLGRNGHIGFNEPGSSLGSRTRLEALEAGSIADSKAIFGPDAEPPRFAITMGVGTLMEARRVLMLAMGAEKADVVCRMLEGPITAEVPASALQMHRRPTVLLDEAAASKLERREYWKKAYVRRG